MAFLSTAAAETHGIEQSPIRAVASLAKLGTILDTPGVEAGVFEAPLQHQREFKLHRDLLQNIFFEHVVSIFAKYRNTLTEAHTFANIKNDIEQIFASPDLQIGYRNPELRELVLHIIDDLRELLQHFNGYRVQLVTYRGHEGLDRNNRIWHQDDDGQVHILRTYCGPSTEYARDKRGRGRRTFAKGSITIHGPHTWHRAPKYRHSNHRFVIDIRLKKITDYF